MNAVFSTAMSGMAAQSKRIAVSASNVANAQSIGVPTNSQEPGFTPQRVVQVATDAGGVRTKVIPVSPPSVKSFEPNSPDADAEGIVNRPNVSLEQEVVTQIEASRIYQANVSVLKTQDRMLGNLFDAIS